MGRKKKEEKKSFLYINISALLLIFSGIIIVITVFQPQNTTLKNLLLGYFGFSSILLGFVLSILGLYLSPIIKIKAINQKIIIGVFLLFLSSMLFEGIFVSPPILSGLLGSFFGNIVGFWGSLIVGLMIFLLSLYLIFSSKFIHFLKKIFSLDFSSLKFEKIFKKEESTGELGNAEFNEIENDIDFDLKNFNDISTPVEVKVDQKAFEEVDTLTEPLELIKSKNRSNTPPIPKNSGMDLSSKTDEKITTNTSSNLYKNKIWEYPPLDILSDPPREAPDLSDIETRKKVIIAKLHSFGIKAGIAAINVGPSVTQYEIKVDEGTKTSRIISLQNDLALALASPNGSVRIEAPIPGKSHIGIEVPNSVQQVVGFKPMLLSSQYKAYKEKSKLTLALGKDVGGNYIYYPLNKMPHLLVAGATGSGKSVMIHSIIFSILFANSPDECKFIMIDPKRVEMVHYNDIPHLLTPVIHESSQAVSALRWVTEEMDKRLQILSKSGVRNIESYNEKSGFQAMPYIVVIIDELSDIMMTSNNEIEKYIVRIGQMARASGIHMILATQRPSADIITGSIKANVPARIAFNVAGQVDSRVIIDAPGAEKLLGKGDMLFVSPESSKPSRIQGVFVKDEEISKLVTYLKDSDVKPEFNSEILKSDSPTTSFGSRSSSGGGGFNDELFADAVKVVVEFQRGSSSLLQRRLSIGYAKAARLIDDLVEAGVLGDINPGTKSREVLISSAEEFLDSVE